MSKFTIISILSTLACIALAQSTNCPVVPAPMATVLKLTVVGNRNASGHWTKDVNLDYDGQAAPARWDVDFQEDTAQVDGYSFTASARVEGPTEINTKDDLPRLRYIYRGDMMTFQDAASMCEGLGAHLAVINSEAEATQIADLVLKSRNPAIARIPYTFVGLLAEQGAWHTVQGTPLAESGYAKWEAGQPSNSSFVLQSGARVFENCGTVGPIGLLNDSPCEIRLPFICEFPQQRCGDVALAATQ